MATAVRTLRVDDLTWARWQAAALVEGISLPEWIRRAGDDRALAEPGAAVGARKPLAESEALKARPGPASASGDLAVGFRPDFKPEKKR